MTVPSSDGPEPAIAPVAIPADVELEDRIAFDLSARQLVILGVGIALEYLLYTMLSAVAPVWVVAVPGVPLAAVVIAVALGRRDGISADRWLLAAVRHLASTRPETGAGVGLGAGSGGGPNGAAPVRDGPNSRTGRGDRLSGWAARWSAPRRPAPPRELPAGQTAEADAFGVLDLGADGLACLASAGSVSLGMASPSEQAAMVACFAGWLQSLTRPTQILIRALPLDLRGYLAELQNAAAGLPPVLARAATAHAEHLARLGAGGELLRREVLLIFRQPPPPGPARRGAALVKADRAAITSLGRRLDEAAQLLAPAGVSVTALNAHQAATAWRDATHPYTTATPTTPRPASPGATPRAEAGVGVGVADTLPLPVLGDSRPAAPESGPDSAPGSGPDSAQGWYPLDLGGWSE